TYPACNGCVTSCRARRCIMDPSRVSDHTVRGLCKSPVNQRPRSQRMEAGLGSFSQPEAFGVLLSLPGHLDQPGWVLVNVVFAEGMPDPVVGHHDAAQIGVPVEDDPQQIVGLALVPVGAVP